MMRMMKISFLMLKAIIKVKSRMQSAHKATSVSKSQSAYHIPLRSVKRTSVFPLYSFITFNVRPFAEPSRGIRQTKRLREERECGIINAASGEDDRRFGPLAPLGPGPRRWQTCFQESEAGEKTSCQIGQNLL